MAEPNGKMTWTVTYGGDPSDAVRYSFTLTEAGTGERIVSARTAGYVLSFCAMPSGAGEEPQDRMRCAHSLNNMPKELSAALRAGMRRAFGELAAGECGSPEEPGKIRAGKAEYTIEIEDGAETDASGPVRLRCAGVFYGILRPDGENLAVETGIVGDLSQEERLALADFMDSEIGDILYEGSEEWEAGYPASPRSDESGWDGSVPPEAPWEVSPEGGDGLWGEAEDADRGSLWENAPYGDSGRLTGDGDLLPEEDPGDAPLEGSDCWDDDGDDDGDEDDGAWSGEGITLSSSAECVYVPARKKGQRGRIGARKAECVLSVIEEAGAFTLDVGEAGIRLFTGYARLASLMNSAILDCVAEGTVQALYTASGESDEDTAARGLRECVVKVEAEGPVTFTLKEVSASVSVPFDDVYNLLVKLLGADGEEDAEDESNAYAHVVVSLQAVYVAAGAEPETLACQAEANALENSLLLYVGDVPFAIRLDFEDVADVLSEAEERGSARLEADVLYVYTQGEDDESYQEDDESYQREQAICEISVGEQGLTSFALRSRDFTLSVHTGKLTDLITSAYEAIEAYGEDGYGENPFGEDEDGYDENPFGEEEDGYGEGPSGEEEDGYGEGPFGEEGDGYGDEVLGEEEDGYGEYPSGEEGDGYGGGPFGEEEDEEE